MVVLRNSEMEIFRAVFSRLKNFKAQAISSKKTKIVENSKLIISIISEVETIKLNKLQKFKDHEII